MLPIGDWHERPQNVNLCHGQSWVIALGSAMGGEELSHVASA